MTAAPVDPSSSQPNAAASPATTSSSQDRLKPWLLAAGLVAITLLSALAWWWLQPRHDVLFSGLKPQDMQAMVNELQKLKVPYQLGNQEGVILVDADQVLPLRIKLMGGDLPLQGSVGFELFNNADLGMTEFAQKINFQRALQGEIVRTIQSLEQVKDVRVLLALPEQTLFKQADNRPKASISLTLMPGQSLHKQQVTGIAKLVASAVPGMQVTDVTITDHRGVALPPSAASSDSATAHESASGALELKRELETYLVNKVSRLLEQAYGPGQALASVDVMLDMSQVKTTTEDVLAAPIMSPGAAQSRPAGVVTRERETISRDQNREPSNDATSRNSTASQQRDTEYAVGRRIEQVVSQPGAIRKLQAVVVLKQNLASKDIAQLKETLAAAVGAQTQRGDTIVVQTLSASSSTDSVQDQVAHEFLIPPGQTPQKARESAQQRLKQVQPISPEDLDQNSLLPDPLSLYQIVMLAGIVLALSLLWLVMRQRYQTKLSTNQVDHDPLGDENGLSRLDAAQRQVVLQKAVAWLADGSSAHPDIKSPNVSRPLSPGQKGQ